MLLFVNWQCVPVTEKSGRIHTSAVTVAVLPQADEVPFFSSSSVAFVCVCVLGGGLASQRKLSLISLAPVTMQRFLFEILLHF